MRQRLLQVTVSSSLFTCACCCVSGRKTKPKRLSNRRKVAFLLIPELMFVDVFPRIAAIVSGNVYLICQRKYKPFLPRICSIIIHHYLPVADDDDDVADTS